MGYPEMPHHGKGKNKKQIEAEKRATAEADAEKRRLKAERLLAARRGGGGVPDTPSKK